MPTALVFDTCVLPQRGGINSNPLLSALLRISTIQGFSVYISDVTLSESLNKRKRLAQSAVESLSSAVRDISKIFNLEEFDYYIPDYGDAVAGWNEELCETFSILETHGDDARDALHREASRTPPARATDSDSATGARDSAIWLSTKRMHLASNELTTYFISSNTNDFASSDGSGLRSELADELGKSVGRFLYATSLASAIEKIAPSVELRDISFADRVELIGQADLEYKILDAVKVAVHGKELPQPISLSVNAVRERRAHMVEATRLSQVEIDFGCLSASWSDEIDIPAEPVHGRASAWLYQGNGISSFELDRVTFAGSVLKIL